jgi:hypothetical protein
MNLPDTYFDLVKRFPLAHLKGDNELSAAVKMINELLQQNLDIGFQAYFDVLTDLTDPNRERAEDDYLFRLDSPWTSMGWRCCACTPRLRPANTMSW